MMRRRNGSMLLDVSLAVMLLTVALVAVAQMLAVSARQRHETRWRAIATREVANITEQVMALPWAETTTDQLGAVAMDATTREMLPEAMLEIESTDVSAPRQAKRIRVSLTYRNTAGLSVEPITLVAWKFISGGAE
jgi:Tfp pilus assembly protein PilV